MEQWTTQRLLTWITGFLTEKAVDAPRLSAEMLLSHVLDCRRIDLYTHFDRIVDPDRLAALRAIVKRAGEHEPIAYLVGRTEFYSLSIRVTCDCLIPRPETEMLVEHAIDFLRARPGTQDVLDLCTGSGCIAVAVAKNCPDCRVVATDISDAALAVAAENVTAHNLTGRVRLLCGDLFEPIIAGLDAARFDLITCNPPYVAQAEYEKLDRNVRDYEPAQALLAGPDGLDIYRRIAADVGQYLRPAAALILETSPATAQAVTQLLQQNGLFASIQTYKDPARRERVIVSRR